MLINELSKKTGVSIHTLRYYENLGLFQGTSDDKIKTNNYKFYDETHVEKVEIIQEAKEVGFTLNEIRKILDSWFAVGNKSRAKDQIPFFTKKVEEVDAKIKQLKQIKKRLTETLEDLKKGAEKC